MHSSIFFTAEEEHFSGERPIFPNLESHEQIDPRPASTEAALFTPNAILALRREGLIPCILFSLCLEIDVTGVRWKSEQRSGARCSPRENQTDRQAAGRDAADGTETFSSPGPPRSPRASSVPKKRRFTLPDEGQGHDARVLPQKEVASVSFSSSSIRPSSNYDGSNDVDGGGGARDHDIRHAPGERSTQDSAQYCPDNINTNYKDEEGPICLVVGNVASDRNQDQQALASADKLKNVKLKQLLLQHETSHSTEASAEREPDPGPSLIATTPKRRVELATVDAVSETYYSETQVQTFSAQCVSRPSPSYSHQQRYHRGPYSRFVSETSIEQSIDQIIRASVAKEADDLDISRDSWDRSSPQGPGSSSFYSTAQMVCGTSTSYQAMPMSMPSLIASCPIGAVSSYFPPQPYGANPRLVLSPKHFRLSNGQQSYHMPPGTPGTSPSGSPASENSLDTASKRFDAGGLYAVAHDSPTARRSMAYHPKTGMETVRHGDGYRQGGAPIYSSEMDLRHWAAIAGNGYAGPISGRMNGESSMETHGLGPDFDDPKFMTDGRMKKRRYPTSRPFKCQHCDQAFNQRIHLKKHMSKHTVVSESTLRFTGTRLSRFRAPPPAPCLIGGPKSMI
ncbi:gastrula Zinc finger protein xlcgf49.1-like [Plakobranchus ocellatus]|uniref:Gastrula Zinc finger protein xlcgf49.1-like n=1 Tax=Plakobranchus ocellatus TaxID=259542 RepID=A0AAV3XXM9_9GAST|nr:gastrula Zinc finger protein xlcgf49.1-like [Plakobranchus ocellatus]